MENIAEIETLINNKLLLAINDINEASIFLNKDLNYCVDKIYSACFHSTEILSIIKEFQYNNLTDEFKKISFYEAVLNKKFLIKTNINFNEASVNVFYEKVKEFILRIKNIVFNFIQQKQSFLANQN